jgi:hypothetical protein
MTEITLTDVFVAEAESREVEHPQCSVNDLLRAMSNSQHRCPSCYTNLIQTYNRLDCPQSHGCGWPGATMPVDEGGRTLRDKVHELASTPNPNSMDELREALNHIYEITKP